MKWLESKNLMLITSSVAVLVIMFSIHTVIASPTQAPPNGNPTFPLQGPAGSDGVDGAQGPQGPQGNQGPQGPTGPGISNCALKTCNTGDWGLCICDAGKQLLGGGCYNTGGGSITQTDMPLNLTTWQCGGGGFNKQINIICCDIG